MNVESSIRLPKEFFVTQYLYFSEPRQALWLSREAHWNVRKRNGQLIRGLFWLSLATVVFSFVGILLITLLNGVLHESTRSF